MRTLIVHNAYGKYSGEEAVVEGIKDVLKRYGFFQNTIILPFI